MDVIEKDNSMPKMGQFKFTCAFLLSLGLPACGVKDGEVTASGAEDQYVPGTYCANPNFADTDGPDEGEYYMCKGLVQGAFQFHGCGVVFCPDIDDPFDITPIDGAGQNGIIPFGGAEDPTEGGEEPTSGDPTEGGGGDQPDVHTCCAPSIEMAGGPGAIEATEACLSECSYAACSTARDRFKAMQTDPASWKKCDEAPLLDDERTTCREHVVESFEHFEAFITDNFAACVASVQDEAAGTVFSMSNPDCADGPGFPIGCVIHASLDMTCNNVSIDFDSNSSTSTCTEALHQPPPEPETRMCVIEEGGGMVRGGEGPITAEISSGSAVTRYFDCGETLCPFVLDGLLVEIEDIEDGDVELSNVTAELYIAAYGRSDGVDVEFAPGAIRVRVTGNVTDLTGTAPFDVVGATSTASHGTHDNDLLELEDVLFEAGGYTFSAYIAPAECDEP